MKFRFIGTGTSVGVPQIGCHCKVCTSTDSRDKRRRCGAYVRSKGGAFLIDTPPEMRLSCVEYGIDRVDAIVLTHAHMDHVAGFDDVRRFNTLNGTMVACNPTDPGANGRTCRCIGKVMKCYAMPETEEQMHRIFPYVSAKGGEHGLYRPQIEFDNADAFEIGDVKVERIRVEHGFPCCGYVMREEGTGNREQGTGNREQGTGNREQGTGNREQGTGNREQGTGNGERGTGNGEQGTGIAYVSDCHVIPDAAVERLEGVDTLVLNCLREREHPTHLRLADSLRYIERIAPRRAYLIHMCHDFTHEEWLAKLPKGVEPAYDGLELEV